MKMSDIGRAALQSREGTKLAAYRDSVGVWTIGTGHTAACGAPIPHEGLTITADAADACLARDLGRFERAIAGALKVPVSQNEFDALVSIAFNVGAGFGNSTAIRKLNAGDRAGAARAIMMWSKPASIIDRREAERDQFVTPYEKALPRARRSDARPVKAPSNLNAVSAGIAHGSPLNSQPPQFKPGIPVPVVAPQPAPPGGLFSALGARLRAAFPKG